MAEQSALDKLTAQTMTATSMTRRAADEARMAEIDSLRKEMVDALKERDQEKLDLINADLLKLLNQEKEEKKALVDTLKGLRDAGKALGVDINVAEEATPAELAKLADAESALAAAKDALEEVKANPGFFAKIFGLQAGYVESAETTITAKEASLEQVKIDNARAVAKRLEGIDIEKASQHLIATSQNAQTALADRRVVIQTEVDAALAEIGRVEAADKDLAGQLDDLIAKVAQDEQALADAKLDLDRIDPATSKEQHSMQTEVVRKAEDALKKSTTERDATMEVRNQVKLNLEYSQAHLAGQRDILSALEVFQRTMEEQLSGLVVQYKSRVEAARALADLKFSSDVLNAGNVTQSQMADYMRQAGAAANQEVAGMAESQPEAIRRERDKRAESEEASAATQARIDAVFADMERDYQLSEDAAA